MDGANEAALEDIVEYSESFEMLRLPEYSA
jgi:hypothetical protein